MKTIYLALLSQLRKRPSTGLEFDFFFSMQRSLLQYVAIASIEYYSTSVRDDSAVDLNDILHRIHSPNDSTAVDILDILIPPIRQQGWPSFCQGWFERPPEVGQNLLQKPLVTLLTEWVAFRNDRPGHGVVDAHTIETSSPWLIDLIHQSLIVLEQALPIADTGIGDDCLSLETPYGSLSLNSLRAPLGKPLVIRKTTCRGGNWRVKYQTLDIEQSREGTYDLDPSSPLISFSQSVQRTYSSLHVPLAKSDWRPLVLIPNRQTPVFEGREQELSDLYEWFNDLESRACLVYGDGGIGKTTLVLEFLHDILESQYSDLEFMPDIICFYSAKQTKWTPEGVRHIKGIAPMLEEAVRLLVTVFEERLGRSWYSAEGRQLVDKASTMFSDVGVMRKDILLILDNTETLARKPSEEKDLARLITLISSKLARVIITSRRREGLEARPLEVSNFQDEEGARLLKALADEYKAEAIQRAGEARLRKISRAYGGKPLLMESLARYISLTGFSIDEANKKILKDAKEGLCEFLYEDAWRRITQEQQIVFLVLGTLELPVNNIVGSWACSAANMPHSLWLDAFNETYFGKMTEYGTDYDIEFDRMAEGFFSVKLDKESDKNRSEVNRIKGVIKRKYMELAKAENAYVTDRVMEAFKTGAARAAKYAASRGENDEALEWYKEALTEDSDNSYLYDRVAWFLMNQFHDYEAAEKHANIAIKLGRDNPDAHFTAGLIAFRQNKINEGDSFMKKSSELGKKLYLCWIQRARARIELARVKKKGEEQQVLLEEGYELLHSARHNISDSDPYYQKNLSQCDILLDATRALIKKYNYSMTLDVKYRRSMLNRLGVYNRQ